MVAIHALVKRKMVLWPTVSWLQTTPLTQALVEVVLTATFMWELGVQKG
jgi:hypothetical protein